MFGRDEKYIQDWSNNSKGTDHTEDNRHRGEDNIRMDLKEKGWEGVAWMRLAQDRDQRWALVNTVMNVRVP
jgi:hypothetical protein